MCDERPSRLALREAKQRRLREAWHGPLKLAQIARAQAVSESTVQRFWYGEQTAGRLPRGTRPHFVETRDESNGTAHKPDAPMSVAEANAIAAEEGRGKRRCAKSCDALLAALRRHHPDQDNAASQTIKGL